MEHFPDGFTFGVATSAYQVEGNVENDWSDWERRGRLKDPQTRCGRAVDHWNRFEADYRLAVDLGARALRVSLEWARIEPERGRFDERALEDYRTRLVRMRALGLRPVVTLHHFTHPAWFHREVPWESPESVSAFRRFARACAEVLAGLDALVLTFNEPMVLLLGGYLAGLMPPGWKDGKKALAALEHIACAHFAAREEILGRCGKTDIGISQNVLAFAPERWWHPMDAALTRMAGRQYNHALLEGLATGDLKFSLPGSGTIRRALPGRDGLDFIGVNYYTRAHLAFRFRPPYIEFNWRDPNRRGLTHIGWEDYPEGLLHVLMEFKRYGLPVWVTENGIDDREGGRRAGFLHAHWRSLLAAQRAGVDIRGYLHWSLLDNFEWLEGWGPRFGLYRVDFETLERTPTPACEYFKKVATSGVLSDPVGRNVARTSPNVA